MRSDYGIIYTIVRGQDSLSCGKPTKGDQCMADSKGTTKKKRIGLGLKAKMILGIIPVVLIGLVIVTYVSTSQAGSEINSLTEQKASEMLNGNINSINSTLQEFRTTALALSRTVGATYETTDLATYEDIFSRVWQTTILCWEAASGLNPECIRDRSSQAPTGQRIPPGRFTIRTNIPMRNITTRFRNTIQTQKP